VSWCLGGNNHKGGTMKKLVILSVVLLIGFAFGNANAFALAQDANSNSDPCELKKFSLSVGAGMRNFSEDLFKEVYGKAGMSFNVDFGVKIWKSLEVFLHTDYFSTDGETTYTKEETTLRIIPIEWGVRYLIRLNKECKPKLFPYFGGGGGYYMYKEENDIGTVDEKKFGFFLEGGFRFYFIRNFFLDAKIKNVFLKVEGAEDQKIELGGLSFMGGIGISF
jgi:hypothetical protein